MNRGASALAIGIWLSGARLAHTVRYAIGSILLTARGQIRVALMSIGT